MLIVSTFCLHRLLHGLDDVRRHRHPHQEDAEPELHASSGCSDVHARAHRLAGAVPLGIWTDKFGGRIVMAAVMAPTVPAIWVMGYATEYWHFLTIGLFVGLAGLVLGGHALRGALVFPSTARARPWACTARQLGRGR